MKRWLIILLLCVTQAQAAPWSAFRRGSGIPPQLLWIASVDSVDSYIIYCGTSSGIYTLSDDVGNVTSVKIASTSLTLVKGTTYYCTVRSVLTAVESTDAGEVCFVWHGANARTGNC